MTEPAQLATVLAEFAKRHDADSRMGRLALTLLRAHGTNQDRRAAVLKHPDLARRVAAVLDLHSPAHWTGYIPPALAIDDDGGLLRRVGQDGRAVFNQIGHRSCGPVPNNAPQRMALLEISAEAWEREHNQAITEDNAELLELFTVRPPYRGHHAYLPPPAVPGRQEDRVNGLVDGQPGRRRACRRVLGRLIGQPHRENLHR